jgi:hypothetical protein
VSRLHIRLTLRFVQRAGEGALGRVTLDSNKSKDKKRVLAKSAKGGLSKDATLATTKLSKIVRTQAHSPGLPSVGQAVPAIKLRCQAKPDYSLPMDRGRQGRKSVLDTGCLRRPLATRGGGPTDESPLLRWESENITAHADRVNCLAR